jgi:cytochrome c oxidase cbb3-type subunit III
VRRVTYATFLAAGMAAGRFTTLAVAQEEPGASPATVPAQESNHATQMRQFLGLGREPDAKAAALGAKVFRPACSFCHGADARGGTGPDLLRSSVVLDDDRGEAVGPVVRKGIPNKGMPAFPAFSDEQLGDLAEFLHLQVYLAANRGTYEIQDIVTGSPEAGKAYFNGEGKCNTCHSPSGDLAHIGSKLRAPDLQQTLLYPGSVGPRAAPRVTVVLKDGKTVAGTLKHLDDFYVSLYDSLGNYHSIELKQSLKVSVEDKLVFHQKMLEKYTDAQIHDLTAYLVTLK